MKWPFDLCDLDPMTLTKYFGRNRKMHYCRKYLPSFKEIERLEHRDLGSVGQTDTHTDRQTDIHSFWSKLKFSQKFFFLGRVKRGERRGQEWESQRDKERGKKGRQKEETFWNTSGTQHNIIVIAKISTMNLVPPLLSQSPSSPVFLQLLPQSPLRIRTL